MISLWENHKEAGKRNICWFKAFSGHFWGSMGSPKGPKGIQDGKQCAMKSWDWTFYYEMISLWKKMCVTYIEGGQMTKEWFGTCFGHFQALRALPRPPNGPQLFRMDNLVCHENSRRDILQWEDFIMGTPSDIYIENGQRIVWRFEACFDHF